jgi:hypothetical protein
MRDRQPIGNVAQQEVVEATCSSAQVPTVSFVINGASPEPALVIPPNYYPAPSSVLNNIPQPVIPAGKLEKYVLFLNNNFVYLVPASVLGYQPCAQNNEWYVSQQSIRCSTSFAATGFAPDPKDCSKYYACDSYVGTDGMSTGKINKNQSYE